MEYFDLSKVESVTITFENMQQCNVDPNYLTEIGVEQSKMPLDELHYGYIPYITTISLHKDIYRSPDILERLCQYNDITWIDIAFKNKNTCTWCVPWEDDPTHEDNNKLQHNNIHHDGLSIYINDFEVFE